MVVETGTNASLAAVPAVTVKVTTAPLNPAALTLTVALPVVIGVKVDVALPALGVTGDSGLNVPTTPLTAKLIGVVAELTVLPLASWMVAT